MGMRDVGVHMAGYIADRGVWFTLIIRGHKICTQQCVATIIAPYLQPCMNVITRCMDSYDIAFTMTQARDSQGQTGDSDEIVAGSGQPNLGSEALHVASSLHGSDNSIRKRHIADTVRW